MFLKEGPFGKRQLGGIGELLYVPLVSSSILASSVSRLCNDAAASADTGVTGVCGTLSCVQECTS